MLQAQVQALYSVLHLLRTFGVDFRQPHAIFLSTPKFRLTFQRSALSIVESSWRVSHQYSALYVPFDPQPLLEPSLILKLL